MAKSYFAILEVSSNATSDEVHAAYRRLAKAYHPDFYQGGSEPFQQIQEAYSVLGNPAKRRAYENRLANVRVKKAPVVRSRPEPEPLIPDRGPIDIGAISPVRSFETFSPSFDEIFDWLWSNFSSVEKPKSRRVQNLTHPSVAKAGGCQSQGAKGEAVALYCDPLATPDLASSGFPGRVKK
jgi:molecular chaperone DnaJ